MKARLKCRPSLQLRLWLGAFGLGVLTLSGTGLAVYGLNVTEKRAQEALAAQTRLEAWSNLSTQINQWMLQRITEGVDTSSLPVEAAIERLESLTQEDVTAAPNRQEASLRAADIRYVARMKSFFQQLRSLQPSSPAGQAGIAFQLTHAPPIISSRIEHETRRRDAALNSLERLRAPLRLGMAGFAIAAPLLLFLLWRGTLRPLFHGLRRVTQEAADLGDDGRFSAPSGHDELGLMVARMRQAAARLSRRRKRLEEDLNNLENLVSARTAELSQANDRLSAIDANRRRFFADVSHELRTPLTVILGEAELGAMTPDPELRQSFQTIGARAERLFRRIEDLLRIARSESGELELSLRPVGLAQAIEAAKEDVAPLLERAAITLTVAQPPDCVVIADRDWLRQMFAGFFENAVKFAGKGSMIDLTAQETGRYVKVTIADNGQAPPAADAILFERHHRSAPHGVNGFGMGLALARWAARAFGGELRRLPRQTGFCLELELLTAEGSDHG